VPAARRRQQTRLVGVVPHSNVVAIEELAANVHAATLLSHQLRGDVTLTATWIATENSSSSLWMAADSRISDEAGTLLDEGVKVYEVPVLAWMPDESGFFNQSYLTTSIGMCCAGSTLVFQQMQATLAPLLANLKGFGHMPSLRDVAGLAAQIYTLYVRSRLSKRPDAVGADIVIGGADPISGALEAYTLTGSGQDSESRTVWIPVPIDLSNDHVHFTGSVHAKTLAAELLANRRADRRPGNPVSRAPLGALRDVMNESSIDDVGGDIQLGHTQGSRFRRVATVTQVVHGQSHAKLTLNNVDVGDLPQVGPCFAAPDALALPY
jgi:hypothetical protein